MDASILCHPNIPKPLHGTAPRVVKKSPRAWWLNQKRGALAKADNHCMACGIHKDLVPYRPGVLEAHEQYSIDYSRGHMTYVGCVAICNACHIFIHSGRLTAMYQKNTVSRRYFRDIMTRGFDVLRKAGLQPSFSQATAWLAQLGYSPEHVHEELAKRGIVVPVDLIRWDDWRLVVDGEYYKPVLSEQEWENKYGHPL